MPVMSFSISESLKKFLKKAVTTNAYKNNSNVVRDALTRLMESSDVSGVLDLGVNASNSPSINSIAPSLPNIVGNVMITFKTGKGKIDKRINKLEYDYSRLIKVKSSVYYSPNVTYTYVLEGNTLDFHSFVSSMNNIEELDNFRYMILDNIEDEDVGYEKA